MGRSANCLSSLAITIRQLKRLLKLINDELIPAIVALVLSAIGAYQVVMWALHR
jgi:hypothetical protein